MSQQATLEQQAPETAILPDLPDVLTDWKRVLRERLEAVLAPVVSAVEKAEAALTQATKRAVTQDELKAALRELAGTAAFDVARAQAVWEQLQVEAAVGMARQALVLDGGDLTAEQVAGIAAREVKRTYQERGAARNEAEEALQRVILNVKDPSVAELATRKIAMLVEARKAEVVPMTGDALGLRRLVGLDGPKLLEFRDPDRVLGGVVAVASRVGAVRGRMEKIEAGLGAGGAEVELAELVGRGREYWTKHTSELRKIAKFFTSDDWSCFRSGRSRAWTPGEPFAR